MELSERIVRWVKALTGRRQLNHGHTIRKTRPIDQGGKRSGKRDKAKRIRRRSRTNIFKGERNCRNMLTKTSQAGTYDLSMGKY